MALLFYIILLCRSKQDSILIYLQCLALCTAFVCLCCVVAKESSCVLAWVFLCCCQDSSCSSCNAAAASQLQTVNCNDFVWSMHLWVPRMMQQSINLVMGVGILCEVCTWTSLLYSGKTQPELSWSIWELKLGFASRKYRVKSGGASSSWEWVLLLFLAYRLCKLWVIFESVLCESVLGLSSSYKWKNKDILSV